MAAMGMTDIRGAEGADRRTHHGGHVGTGSPVREDSMRRQHMLLARGSALALCASGPE
jgi:hypothetical protein